MNSHFEEKMTEIIIGEAVTSLLDSHASITWVALLDKLHIALDKETDEVRVRAVLRAIEDVRKEMRLKPGNEVESASLEQRETSQQKFH
ncbi:hypothetical protein LU196_13455 [Pantoea sp. Mb-10]|uniref:hypothetical protein n=1 Tax=unclassified Pantoea TaxID=2630326 RepID=UPI001E3C5097|nr:MULTISPECIES: hypothetical protein [unclassified Pantoea]MCE0491048.1 hypothetical protein [Pantoea sp. Mb-10]MCE0502537.1 hypothetical protein [Pantoea sp. Pb-8]